jgi:hypothetical protein
VYPARKPFINCLQVSPVGESVVRWSWQRSIQAIGAPSVFQAYQGCQSSLSEAVFGGQHVEDDWMGQVAHRQQSWTILLFPLYGAGSYGCQPRASGRGACRSPRSRVPSRLEHLAHAQVASPLVAQFLTVNTRPSTSSVSEDLQSGSCIFLQLIQDSAKAQYRQAPRRRTVLPDVGEGQGRTCARRREDIQPHVPAKAGLCLWVSRARGDPGFSHRCPAARRQGSHRR